MRGWRYLLDHRQLVSFRHDPLDDAYVESLDDEDWPMPRWASSGPAIRVMTEQEVEEVTRAFLQAVAEAVAEIDEDGGLHHG